jgi:hypothetical protein
MINGRWDRYTSLESLAQVSDDLIVKLLSAVAA